MNWFWQFCCAATASVLLLTAPQAAIAAPAPPVPLTAQDSAELQRIAAYLQGIRTMTAKFHQAVAKGGDATGSVWVARPGKMRFQYDPPNELLMLADAFYIYSWDPELKSMNKVGLRSTPAWFLLRDPISFTGDVAVTRFEHSGNTVRVSVVQAAEPDQGSLTMEFTENPLILRQWVVDQKGRATTVALSDVQFGMALDPKLFQYQDPYSR